LTNVEVFCCGGGGFCGCHGGVGGEGYDCGEEG
jgi:hypothetical protein